MITSNLISKTYNLGKCLFNNSTIRLSTPKIGPAFFYAPFAGLKSQAAIELPEKPKRPTTPYLKYVKEHRVTVVKEHPEFKATEVVRKCAEDWKNVHSTIKERYENEYKEEQMAYAEKFLEYSAKLTDEQKAYIKEMNKEKRESSKRRKNKQQAKELNKPKKPPSAFMLYLMDQSKIRNRKLNELMVELKGHWQLLDETDKALYEEQSQISKTKYLKDLKDWEMKMLQDGNANLVRVKTLEEKRPASARRGKGEVEKKKKDSKSAHEKNINEE